MKAAFLSVFVWSFLGFSTVLVAFAINSKTAETTTAETTVAAAVTADVLNNAPQPADVEPSLFSAASTDSKTIEPFRAGFSQDGAVIVTVPLGKLLVIELVSGSVTTPGSDSEVPIELRTSLGATITGLYQIAPSHTRPNGADTYAIYTQQVRIYATPGERLQFNWLGDEPAFRQLAVSGYLVDER